MTLEHSIERKACREAEREFGVVGIKVGQDGWPDRLFPLGKDCPGAVLWVEFKTPEGRLRPNQIIRHKQLARQGHDVAVCRSWQEAIGAIAKARRSYLRSN